MSVHNSQILEPAQVLGVFSQSSVLLLQSTRLGWISKVTMVIMMIMVKIMATQDTKVRPIKIMVMS